LTTSKSNL